MPELPEVETVKEDLKQKIVGARILEAKTDWEKIVKEPSFDRFSQQIVGKKIVDVSRRAKNIIVTLSAEKTLLIHLKMTGHLLVADETIPIVNGKWVARPGSSLADPQNQFIHLILDLDTHKVLALSDLRKFASVRLVSTEKLSEILADYGPEPLDPDFTFDRFKEALKGRKGPIKKVLMDQSVIAGIGNIYADEILFDAKIYPKTPTLKLTKDQLRRIYESIPKILAEAIRLRGTSTSDFRDTAGDKGSYGDVRRVYRKHGEPCPVCGTKIERITVGGRGTHFCPNYQKH